ncbi:hypothetical protein [Nonomuraea typhae]|uniref:Uncharacterized protein n=1 Tax=Nonomuraea typhae TaxID=2603600 RepID=A0ABW7YN56_9ACTN
MYRAVDSYHDDTEQESVSITDVFPVEIHDQCSDCVARWDAPPKQHHVACSTNWT